MTSAREEKEAQADVVSGQQEWANGTVEGAVLHAAYSIMPTCR